MDVKLSDAAGRLNELVNAALAGRDVTLSRDGRTVVRLIAVENRPQPSPVTDWDAFEALAMTVARNPERPELTVAEMRQQGHLGRFG